MKGGKRKARDSDNEDIPPEPADFAPESLAMLDNITRRILRATLAEKDIATAKLRALELELQIEQARAYNQSRDLEMPPTPADYGQQNAPAVPTNNWTPQEPAYPQHNQSRDLETLPTPADYGQQNAPAVPTNNWTPQEPAYPQQWDQQPQRIHYDGGWTAQGQAWGQQQAGSWGSSLENAV
ncbi:hypothetical protein BDZ97DRAFT_1925009 [Flammula alnicola]|nr:hypothetical protein BDZ97DRAFT_1925009 [Flammula alnicola]